MQVPCPPDGRNRKEYGRLKGINKFVDFLTYKANTETFESQLTNIYNMVKDNE